MDIGRVRTRVRRAMVTGVAALLGLSACTSPPPPAEPISDVDRQRAAYLTQEPILTEAIEAPKVRPGVWHSDRVGWDRTEVTAELYSVAGGQTPDPVEVERQVAAAAATLRQSHWIVHWEMCLPPPTIDLFGGEVDPVAIPVQVPRLNAYEWIAAGFKIVDGVSYGVLVVGARGDDAAFVDVLLRAPNAHDQPNLFADPPAALTAEQSCAEDGAVSDEVQKAGAPRMIRDWWPYPAQTRTRDPNHL